MQLELVMESYDLDEQILNDTLAMSTSEYIQWLKSTSPAIRQRVTELNDEMIALFED